MGEVVVFTCIRNSGAGAMAFLGFCEKSKQLCSDIWSWRGGIKPVLWTE